MSRLSIKVKEVTLPNGVAAVDGKLVGSMDIGTVANFDKQVNSFIAKGLLFFYFDCSKLDYINSTGMGLLVKVSDDLKEKTGKIHFYAVTAKIEALLKMLGLTEVIQLYPDQQSAIEAFSAKEEEDGEKFPFRKDCPNCSTEVEFPEPGQFRCPVCNEYFDVNADAKWSSFSNARLRFIELKMPLEVGFFSGLQMLARALLDDVKLPAAIDDAVLQVLDEFCNFLLFAQDPKKHSIQVLHVMVIADREEARAVFRTQRNIIEDLDSLVENSLPMKMISQLMDQIDVVKLPKGGQLISLVKSYSSPVSAASD